MIAAVVDLSGDDPAWWVRPLAVLVFVGAVVVMVWRSWSD